MIEAGHFRKDHGSLGSGILILVLFLLANGPWDHFKFLDLSFHTYRVISLQCRGFPTLFSLNLPICILLESKKLIRAFHLHVPFWYWWLVTKSCLTLETPMDYYSPPGSCVHGILQARILERVAISFSISDIVLSLIEASIISLSLIFQKWAQYLSCYKATINY